MSIQLTIGIDEVGRGPLAGPVAVGITIVPASLDITALFQGLTDSKKMTESSRARVAGEAENARADGVLQFGVFSLSAERVDSWGIERALQHCIERGLAELAPNPAETHIYLDGRLKAPKEYRQETVIRGDALIPAISLASVVAKVARDRYMSETLHPKLPEYGFDAHKGYGTASHIAAIKEYGPSPEHRKTFLTRILPSEVLAGTMHA